MILAPWQRAAVCAPPPWTPAAVPGCILYGGAYQEARATRGAAPGVPGAGWTGANWAGSGLGPYQHTAGATADLTQAILIAGNRYTAAFAVSGLTAGTVTHKQGTAAGAVRSANGSYTDELTAQATSALWTPSNDFDGAVLVSSIANRSITSYTPAFTTIPGSVLAQATATAQPWVSSDGLGIRYQGGDLLQWSAAASAVKCLHDGTGGTLIFAVRLVAYNAAQSNIIATANTAPANVGMALIVNAAGTAITLHVANGSGTLDINIAGVTSIALATTYVFALRVAAGAGGVTLRKNGATVITTALTAPSAANPTTGLMLGGWAAGSSVSMDGIVGHPFVANRVLTDAECTQVEQYILAQATL